jgi:hypothetical protein
MKCISIPHNPPSPLKTMKRMAFMAEPRIPKRGPKKYPMNKRGRSPGEYNKKGALGRIGNAISNSKTTAKAIKTPITLNS